MIPRVIVGILVGISVGVPAGIFVGVISVAFVGAAGKSTAFVGVIVTPSSLCSGLPHAAKNSAQKPPIFTIVFQIFLFPIISPPFY